jgi:hypothetical protein
MDTKQIKQHFMFTKEDNLNYYRLTTPENDFVKYIGFKELKSWDVSGRDDCVEIHIGKVGNRYFWYRDNSCKVWYDDWGFLDEIREENA